jgi:serine/threonine-protein kinase SRPK3
MFTTDPTGWRVIDVTSSKVPSEIPELAISQKLRASLPPSESVDFRTDSVDHHFFVQGPNSSHLRLFLTFPLAGPSILAMSNSTGRAAGSRRLRADLARKVTKQTAIMMIMMMHHMHCTGTGVIHGGKQSSASFSMMQVADE